MENKLSIRIIKFLDKYAVISQIVNYFIKIIKDTDIVGSFSPLMQTPTGPVWKCYIPYDCIHLSVFHKAYPVKIYIVSNEQVNIGDKALLDGRQITIMSTFQLFGKKIICEAPEDIIDLVVDNKLKNGDTIQFSLKS